MATVELHWQNVSTTGGDEIHRCEVKARNGKDAVVMEVHGGKLTGGVHIVTVYYWFENSQRSIPLHPFRTSGTLDDAKTALKEWYFANAPTLLTTLAG